MQNNTTLKGHLCALVSILVWGTTFVSTKVLLNDLLPVEILLVRFTLGTLALLLIYPHRMKLREKRHHLLFLAAGVSGVTIYFLTENIALTYTNASNVGVIVSVSPLFTAILMRFLEKGNRLRMNFIIGFVCALAGIGIISFAGSQLSLNPLGDLLALASAFSWSVYSILLKKINTLGYNSLGVTRRIFAYGLVLILPVAFAMGAGPGLVKAIQPVNLLNLLYLGLGASTLCFVTWNYAVAKLGPVKGSAYIYAVPVVAVVCSALLLGEQVTPPILCGILLTLAGLVLSELHPRKKKGTASGKT